MPNSIVGLILAFFVGAGISYVNYRLTARSVKNPSEQIAAVSLLRQFLNIGYLAVVFFLAPYTPWDRIWMLVGAVLGVTVPMFLFTFLLLRQVNRQSTDRGGEDTKGGEK